MVERGRADASSPHPRDLAGLPGASELTRDALDAGFAPQDILESGLMKGMTRIGEKFRDRLVYVPDVLLAARAMKVSMEHLQQYFRSSDLKRRGILILGTVRGDLHDIGKRLVGMIVEGAGYEVVDLGTDVPADRFIDALERHPGAAVGLSALLTTTMIHMGDAVDAIKRANPAARVIVGGAPVSDRFAATIGADAYAPDPYGAVEFLGRSMSASPEHR